MSLWGFDLTWLSTFEGQKTAGIAIVIVGAIGFLLWLADQLFAPISVVPHGIVGFFGRRGAGKSFGMVTYARRWRHFNPNKPVFTNLEKMELPGYNGRCTCKHDHVEIPEDQRTTTDPHAACHFRLNGCKAVHISCNFSQIEACRDGLVAIDEAGIFISSLNFVDRKNRQFARWLVGTRHYKVMVILTAHTPGTVNNRLRDVIDQFIMMEAYTTLKLFKGLVYDSGAAYGRPKQHSQTVFIPMWRTTANSYNTDSLRRQAEAREVEVIGEDFEIPGLGEATLARLGDDNSIETEGETTTTNKGRTRGVSSNAMGDPEYTGTHRVLAHYPNSPSDWTGDNYADFAILRIIAEETARTWNGRSQKPTRKPIKAVVRSR